MSATVPLPESALEFINTSEPAADQVTTLAGLSSAAFESLVVALERRELIDHLELLAELAAAGREAKKLAATAAYRLKSRGVKGRSGAVPMPQPHAGERSEPVDLSLVALAAPPGIVGRYWLLLGGLPGTESLEVKGDADGGIEGIEVLRSVSRSKLVKLAREFDRKSVRGLPVKASADLAVQLVRSWGKTLQVARTPVLWRQVEAWCDRAVALGAEPLRASSRRIVAADANGMSPAALYAFEGGGLHLPTPAVIQRVLTGMRESLDQTAVEVAEVERRARSLMRGSLESWLDVAMVRERLAVWLESTADVLCAVHGHNEGAERARPLAAAAAFLALADAVIMAQDGASLARHPFFAEVEAALLGTSGRP